MKRREFIAGLSGAAAWPLVAGAQQSGTPMVGFLSSRSPNEAAGFVAAFRQGLAEGGFTEGQNVALTFRWAGGQYDKLPELAADLVRRQVNVIATSGGPASALAAKATTSDVPIVFAGISEPVRYGVVTSLSRPEGNTTGVSIFTSELTAKRLGLLHQLVPRATSIAVLENPKGPGHIMLNDTQEAASALGVQVSIVTATTDGELDEALADIAQRKFDAFMVMPDPFLEGRRRELVAFSARNALPAVFAWREFVEAGGLMSYGTNLADSYRQAGVYVARVLKGERPADLPMALPTKFEFLINIATANGPPRG
jgi:putative tryptophan/tyrosine transport system substrate-binding protein